MIVLGDHGTNLTEHNIYFSSSSLYDDTIHAPLIAHFPGFSKAEVEGFVQDTDIAPTILELIGEKSEEEWKFDGKSMINLIKNNEEIRDKVEEDVRGVRTKDRKVIYAPSRKCHLCKGEHHKEWEEYDLKNDPEEKNNIYSKIGPLAENII